MTPDWEFCPESQCVKPKCCNSETPKSTSCRQNIKCIDQINSPKAEIIQFDAEKIK